MGYFDPTRLCDPAERECAEDVALLLMVSEANLRRERADLLRIDALERVAQDEALPARARRRAATVLVKSRLGPSRYGRS